MSFRVPLAALLLLLATGCEDANPTSPRDRIPPAAPRGLVNVTGDHSVTLHWLANTESDVTGYRIYEGPCASGGSCPYDRVGATAGTSFVVDGLANGVTRYFAVSAVDQAGNESDLSYEDVFDTPRPAGYGEVLNNALETTAGSGWDFSAALARPWNDPGTDMYFSENGSIALMVVPDPSSTSIQDMGYASSLDAVDWAPSVGWAPSGTVELIAGHDYVVWTRDDHYAKFRVTARTAHTVTFDWAYQVAAGNPELKIRPVGPGGAAARGATAAAGAVAPGSRR
jgi:hypothetical protein